MKEQLLEYFFEKSPVAFSYHKVIPDDKGNPYDYELLKVNTAYEKIIGLKASEVIGKGFNELIPLFDEDAERLKDACLDAVRNNKTEVFDAYNKRTLKWIRITIFSLDKYYFACIYTDVTENLEPEVNLDEIAITAEFSDLATRDFFDQTVLEVAERADFYNEPLSMIILDLDNFKNVNETWGQTVGDDLLKQTLEITNRVIRKYDILGRLSSKEIVLLMPKTTINGATAVAEKIREAIDNSIHPIAGKVTASFGVAERMNTESFNNWYKRLNGALYRAKEAGRNRVVTADEQEILPLALLNLQWKDEWESGNKNIDDQNKKLIELISSLIHMSLSAAESEKATYQLDTLIEHIVQHFDYEEQVLFDIGYFDYDKHSKIHKNLVGKAFQLKESYHNGDLKPSVFFSFMVDEVIIGHLINDDMKFFPYTSNYR